MRGANNAHNKVNQAFEALHRQGYICFVQRELQGQRYAVPRLTQKGWQAIQAGSIFGWQVKKHSEEKCLSSIHMSGIGGTNLL